LRTKPWFPFNATFVVIGYTVWSRKTWHFTFAHIFTNYWPIFKIFFTGTLCRQFAITCSLHISPYHKCVFTLPCEISRWTHVCCINVGSTSNFDVDDVLKRCWICKLDRRRNVDIVGPIDVAVLTHFKRRSPDVVVTLNVRAMDPVQEVQSSCALTSFKVWGENMNKKKVPRFYRLQCRTCV